ncbi:dethiobiotin synthase [Aureivirga sp. CE67]|uniref:dethiobiotin synthase n=1 Tax=Aureivirga sp. CE67 TaxID=1788983 RepID=UPI0018CB5B2B|nr:dethiobiotin synthase [Aureivirga sp. CE67]
MKKYFITGIGTEVGKTIASAVVTESLQADYWKPIQAGELEYSDTDKVRDFISNTKTKFHPNAYGLKTPMSPHAAAEIENIEIDLEKIVCPETENNLVIEGAGGLLVPLNNTETIADLLKPEYKIIVVSRHYLGSINHTLMTIEMIRNKGLEVAGIIFNGDEHPTTESIIQKMTNVPVIGRINEEKEFTKEKISFYANQLQENLLKL